VDPEVDEFGPGTGPNQGLEHNQDRLTILTPEKPGTLPG
jgi:hypothetical protein